MILTCPNCATQYVVKDGAIPPQGRQVRCASCKHSWHQDPEEGAELQLQEEQEVEVSAPMPEREVDHPDYEASADVAGTGDADDGFAEATMIGPSTGPEAEERAYEESIIENAEAAPEPVLENELGGPVGVADYDAEPEAETLRDDEFSPFAARETVGTRRRSPLLAVLLLVVLIAAAAAAFWFLAPPEWRSKLGLAETKTPLQLSNPPHMELVQLQSGNQLLTVAGRVINPTDQAHPVPPIYAELYDHGGKVIYKWTIAPPTPTLGPGASASFNSAEINVPSGAEGVTISLGPPKA